jgi:hypothetical protein
MKPPQTSASSSASASFMSQTELYMKAILEGKYQIGNLLENTRTEKTASRDTVFLYHGCDSTIAFAYEIYSAVHKIFQANPEHNAFRGNHLYFEPFKNIAEFEAHYIDQFGNIDNNKKDYHEMAISANYALFGSHESPTSNSIAYFLDNKISRAVNLSKLLRSVLPQGIPDSYLQTLLDLYQTTYPKNKGVLYQIAISAEIANQYTYLAQPGGNKLPYKHNGTPGNILSLLLEDFKTEPKFVTDYLKDLQKCNNHFEHSFHLATRRKTSIFITIEYYQSCAIFYIRRTDGRC